jgi:hypothetical protein
MISGPFSNFHLDKFKKSLTSHFIWLELSLSKQKLQKKTAISVDYLLGLVQIMD